MTAAAPVRHPPGPSGRKLLGSLREIRRDRIRFVTEAARDYGDVVSFRMGPRRLYLLRHPDHFRHVLVDNPQNYEKGLGLRHARELLGAGLLTSEGPVWLRQRKEMAPALANEGNLERFAERAAEIAERRIARWPEGRPVDVAREMTLLGIAIAASAMLGCDLEDRAEQIAADLSAIGADAMRRMTAALPGPWQRVGRQARAALARMDEIAAACMGEDSRGERGCFPGILAGAEGDRREWRDQTLTLLLAGHETTAATLSWTLRMLALHPEAQARMRDELLSVRAVSPSNLPKLRYTAMTLHETMRLYPPVWLLPRRSLDGDTIGGYRIPAASDVLLSVYSMQRHPEFWSEPDRFLPERFAAGGPFRAYMPFGAGPRTCVGQRLGMLETAAVLAALLRRFRFEPVGNDPAAACASLTLHPDPPMWLRPARLG